VSGRLVLVMGKDPSHLVGGGESYVSAHARAAQLAGYEPHVFCLRDRTETLETDFGTLHRVASPLRPIRAVAAGAHRRWLVRALVRELEGEPGPHVLHAFGAWADSAVRAARELGRRGVAAVPLATAWMAAREEAHAKLGSRLVHQSPRLRLLGHLEHRWSLALTSRWEREAYSGCAQVVVNYESVERSLRAEYGPGLAVRHTAYAPPTAFAPEPGDDALPDPLRGLGDPAAPLIVSTSRHDGRKGVDQLIRALALLARDGVPFRACLVGPGALLEPHRGLVCSLGLSGRVAVPGRVPAVMPFLRRADVFVLPSTQEGSGSVSVLEALQAGCAVVSTGVDGMPEDITDEVDGLLVEPWSPEALAAAIARLLRDADARARLAAAGRELYERRFSPQVWAADLRELYSDFGLAPGDSAAALGAERTAPATAPTSASVSEGAEGR
jgi:glycosyltransferase involved in cell wall biosynthesis